MTTMKSCKSILDGFACRKDTQCRFRSWVIGILVGKMLVNRFAMEVPYEFNCRKDTSCGFGSSANEILVREMRDKWAYLEILYQACIWFHMDSPAEKVPSVNLDHQEMGFFWGRWGTNELTWRLRIKPVSGSIYLEEAKRDNDEIVQINS